MNLNDVVFPLPSFATFILFSVSSFGFVLNFYLLVKFIGRKGRWSGFQKLCLVKTIPNITVCASFLFWVVPLSLLQFQDVPRFPNVIVGQIAGAGAYIMGPLIQLCMSGNRCLVLYFPLKQSIVDKRSSTNLAVSISIIVAVIFTLLGFPEECGYIYNPTVFTWSPEPFACAEFQLDVLMYSVFTLSIISNSLNLITAVKLLCCNVRYSSRSDALRRRKRRVMMFIQSTVQDCLHVVDLINCTYIYLLSNNLWFQFMFLTLSFVLIYSLDGLVMFHFHPEIHPKFMQSRRTSVASKPIFTVVSVIL
ncbi:hypothetical protein CRE_05425 [Caenorhabditis remanei]|uniref:7TM GPCR serpentine receptor class x (Srx) domain-containing protein n=1 Tax=Caenorhabditis remanei TaxID=31234 RepID=E3M0H0_CAERE|nr:hypothetical protein CRE_05425 [Caenorhabditis remanei]